MRKLFALALLVLVSCTGLTTQRTPDVPAPRSVAVLPFGGTASMPTRERLRSMVFGRLAQEDVLVIENDWVDRRLSESGYLADPAAFDFRQVDAGAMCVALGVDAVVAGDMVAHGTTRFLLYNSSSLEARLQMFVRDGRRAWFARHCVSESGGLAVDSGQILNAVSRELDYQASREVTFLGWKLIEEMFGGFIEMDAGLDDEHELPEITSASARLESKSEGVQWIVVEAEGTPAARLRFHLDAFVRGVPMVEVSPGRYRGIWRRTQQDTLPERPAVEVEIEDRFGHDASEENVEWNA